MVPAAAAAGVTVEAVTRAVAVTAQDRAEPVVEAVRVESTGRGNMGVGGGGECDEAPRDLTSICTSPVCTSSFLPGRTARAARPMSPRSTRTEAAVVVLAIDADEDAIQTKCGAQLFLW